MLQYFVGIPKNKIIKQKPGTFFYLNSISFLYQAQPKEMAQEDKTCEPIWEKHTTDQFMRRKVKYFS